MNVRNFLLAVSLLVGTVLSFAQTVAPNIFYSDLEAGPSTGGENNLGAYVTIYGKNFGVSRGSSTVTIGGGAAAGYTSWSDTKVVFQLGSAAQTGNIVVNTANGSSNGLPFTVRAGSIFFISTSGSDSNPGTFASPWKSLLKARDMKEGDVTYAMNGTSQTSDDGSGFAAAFTLGKNDCGTVPRALVAYPGATVTIGTISGPSIAIRSSAPSVRGGLCAGAWVFAGLTLRGTVSAMDMQGLIGIPANNFRFVANDMSCPNGNGATACAGTARINGIKMYGNNIHDTGTANASALYHGIYFGTDSNHIDFGWNTVANVHGCRGIQVHSSDGNNQFDIKIHDSVIHDTQCDAIILASVDPSKGPVEIYNNLIYNAGIGPNNPEGSGGWTCLQAPGYGFNNTPASGTVEIYHNTMYNCGTFANPPYPGSIGGLLVANVSPNFRVRLRNNIIHSAPGRPYMIIYKGVGQICGDTEACVATNGSNNLFFGNGPPPGNPFLTADVNSDPLFVNASGANFHLQSGSPAKGAGVNTGLPYDFDGVPRTPTIDIGALQAGGGGGSVPSTPDLTILKTHSGNFTQGQNGATYSITVNNSGGGATSGTVTVTETVPAGLTLVSMSGSGWSCASVSCTNSTVLAAGGSYPVITVTVNVASNAAASVTNSATVAGGGESNTGNNTANDATSIIAGSSGTPDLTITKTHSGNFAQGQNGVTYTISVKNSGAASTSGTVTVTENVPSGLTLVSLSGSGWSCGTTTCTTSAVQVAGGSYPNITATFNVSASASSSLTNTATVSGGGESNTGNNSASDPTTITGAGSGAPDLSITKSHSGNFTQGQNGATYTIGVSNAGNASTSGTVTVTDSVPSGLTLVSMSGSGWTCASNSCTNSTALAAGNAYSPITVTVNVSASAAASITNSATVAGGGDGNAGNNTANDPTTINVSGSGGGGGGGSVSGAPSVFYSDLEAGPSNGGENGQGAYVTIYGKNFGSSRGSSTVRVGGGAAANYPIWTDTKIAFQLGSLAQSGNIVVNTANGASNGIPFTVRAGNIYFVSTSGNDSNPGTFASPWRTLGKSRSQAEGDITYAMNGTSALTDDGSGFSAAFTLGKNDCGTVPRALVAYPGATVTIGTITGPAMAIRSSAPSVRGGLCAGAWVFAGLTLRGGTSAMDMQGLIGIPTNNFRFVANDMSCPNGNGATACAGTARLNGIKMFGNNIHDTGTANASALYHGIYFGTDSNHIDFGWNTVANVHGCRGIQIHSSDGNNQFDIKIHDNVIHDTQCDAIILASVDPSKGPVEIYNNLIYNAGIGPNNPEGTGGWTCIQAPGYGFNNTPASGTVEIYHNTMYNCGTFANPPYPGSIGGLLIANVSPNYRVRLRNNIIHSGPGRPYLIIYKAAGAICGNTEACVAPSGSNNIFFGNGAPPGNPFITSSINADPLFVNAAGADFHLKTGTPAKGAGVNTGLAYDFDGVARTPTIDIGALQAGGGGGSAPGVPDLTILKSHNGNFTQGQNGATYSITVNNSGVATTNGTATVNELIPSGLTLVSMTGSGWSCAANTCTNSAALTAGSSYPAITVTVNVAANAAASITNTATVSGGGESNTSNNTVNDPTIINPAGGGGGGGGGGTPTGADLSIQKTHSGNFTQGQSNATYSIAVVNAGSGPTAGTITVTDNIPNGLTLVSMSGAGWTCAGNTCTRSSVTGAGNIVGFISVVVNVAANAPASVTNTATVSGGGETNTANNTANDVTIINAGSGGGGGGGSTGADLTIQKSHSGNFTQGQSGAAYTIAVVNSGSGPTSGNIAVTENVPNGLTLVSMTGPGWTCANNTCNRSSVTGAGNIVGFISVLVNVAANAPANVTNTATVSGGGETNTSNNTASDPTIINAGSGGGGGGGGGAGTTDLSIQKSHTGNFTQGQTGAAYTIAVVNAGGGPTSGTITVTENIPTGLTLVSMTGTGWTCAGNICTRSNVTQAGNIVGFISVVVNVASNAPASVINTATVSGGGDNNASNNTASDRTAINPSSGGGGGGGGGGSSTGADLTIQKSHTGNFSLGQTGAAYNIAVVNGGSGPTTGTITVTENIPNGLTLVSMTGSGWTCSSNTCTRSNVVGAGNIVGFISVVVNVNSNAPATVTNTATVSGGGDSNASNNTASDVTTIVGGSGGGGGGGTPTGGVDITLTKTHSGNFRPGQFGASYTITVRNAGGTASNGLITVTDKLPAGMTGLGISGPGWTCVLETTSCFRAGSLAAGASHPAITLLVTVANNAPASVVNTATVSGGGDTNAANNTANDPTTISGNSSIGVGTFQNGVWTLDTNHDGVFNSSVDRTIQFGTTGDLPVTGDWAGTGASQLGVYRPSTGEFLLDSDGDGKVDRTVKLGMAGTPVVGDWNGSGSTKLGIFSNGTWNLDTDGDGRADTVYQFGAAGDTPVVGDWTGNGIDKLGIYRAGAWTLDRNGDGVINSGDETFAFGGQNGDIPIVGDWGGTGKDKPGIFRQGSMFVLDANGNHALDNSQAQSTFGPAADPSFDWAFTFSGGGLPVVGKW